MPYASIEKERSYQAAYRQRPQVKKMMAEYQRRYRAKNVEKVRAWARKSVAKARLSGKADSLAWYYSNKERAALAHRKWCQSNKAHINAYSKRKREEFRRNNPLPQKQTPSERRALQKEYARRWRAKNRVRHNEKKRIERAIRRKVNPDKERAKDRKYYRHPHRRIATVLRSRMRDAIRRSNSTKHRKTFILTGCSIEELMLHIQSKFKPGMEWNNYGVMWHIDHIRPCASFDLADPDQQMECFHYSNLQPLWVEENLKKGQKWHRQSLSSMT